MRVFDRLYAVAMVTCYFNLIVDRLLTKTPFHFRRQRVLRFSSFLDTSLILLSKGKRNITNITHASFNPRYSFNFSEAVRVCEILNGTLATFEQMQAAWNNGLNDAGELVVIY